MTPKEDSLQDRMEKLERENRRLKRTGLASLIVVGAVLLMGQASSNRTMEANEFVLKGAGGATRARLGMTEGNPRLDIFSDKDKGLLQLAVDAEGPHLVLFDPDGKGRAALQASHESGPALMIMGADGRSSGLTNYEVALLDADSEKRVALGLVNNQPALVFIDQNRNARAGLSLEKDEPVLSFWDANRTKLLTLVVAKGEPSVVLSDRNSAIRAVMGLAAGRSSLMLLDANGRVQFAKP